MKTLKIAFSYIHEPGRLYNAICKVLFHENLEYTVYRPVSFIKTRAFVIEYTYTATFIGPSASSSFCATLKIICHFEP